MLSLLVLSYPAIDPVALRLGPVEIRWYGIAYMLGLLLGWLYIRRLVGTDRLWREGKPPFPVPATDDLLIWMTLGVVLGGRLGQVLFYDLGHYVAHPAEVLAIWRGGMSFHGGLLGALAAIALFARQKGASFKSVADVCAAAVPIGIFFGRLANFVNSEHWGRPSDVAWAMVFPNGGPVPRHPSQLYEAALEGLLLFVVLRYMTHTRLALHRPGLTGGTFLAGYALARIACEFFRQNEDKNPFEIGWVTTGMVYSVPMLVFGLIAVWQAMTTSPGASRQGRAT